MTAIDIVKHRINGISDADAEFYISMAEARIRQHLKLPDAADVSKYVFAIADIAVLYWQIDKSTNQSVNTLGCVSSKFQEGNVSESHEYMNGATISSKYNSQIDDILKGLDAMSEYTVYFL